MEVKFGVTDSALVLELGLLSRQGDTILVQLTLILLDNSEAE